MANPTVHVVMAETFSVPGLRISVHMTEQGANAAAAHLTNLILEQDGRKPSATPGNWQAKAEAMSDKHGASECYVAIRAVELEA